jgi:hypothetical protein
MPWLKQSVFRLSTQTPGSETRSLGVGFVVDKMALTQVFSEAYGFPCHYYSTSLYENRL